MNIPNAVGIVYDRLYGQIPYTAEELRLFQTHEMALLRERSLSAVPTNTHPVSVAASRFEHSLGVMHVARHATQHPDFRDMAKELQAAALSHDIGTPPFSHLAEQHLKSMFGKSHEQFGLEVMDGSEFERELKRQGYDVELVYDLTQGERGPYGKLINGSLDVDNLDNTKRYAVSQGIMNPFMLREMEYNPLACATTFRIRHEQLCMEQEIKSALGGWEGFREYTYKYVYSDQNLCSGTMVSRAIEMARRREKIDLGFFRRTDSQAYQYLMESCGPEAHRLMDMASRWQWYRCSYDRLSNELTSNEESLSKNSERRQRMADEIAGLLRLPAHEVTVHFGKSRAVKENLPPLLMENGELQPAPLLGLKTEWRVKVYLHPSVSEQSSQNLIQDYMAEQLGL
jgi:HD superfamily phosphohydrolase